MIPMIARDDRHNGRQWLRIAVHLGYVPKRDVPRDTEEPPADERRAHDGGDQSTLRIDRPAGS